MLALRSLRTRSVGFTLIEVLVVVVLIALLFSILLPSLAAARERAKRAVCLSNEHQMGLGFGMYANDFRQYLPARDHFVYYIKGTRTIYDSSNKSHTEKCKPINYGMLYGKYVSKDLHIFYCPGNMVYIYDHPDYGAWSFLDRHVDLTFGGYMYAVPMAEGRHPRHVQKWVYPVEHLKDYYVDWRATKTFDPLRRPAQVLLSDALIGDTYKAVHKGTGYNVLYADLHAKWISDPKGYILNLPISSGPGGSPGMFEAWDYFAARP